jgi:hypothetical protein
MIFKIFYVKSCISYTNAPDLTESLIVEESIIKNGKREVSDSYGRIYRYAWEIYLERARYLLNTDELLEEMHGKTKIEITDNIKVEFCRNAGTVCCGTLIDTDEAHGAEIKTVEQLLVCSNNCRKIVEMAPT